MLPRVVTIIGTSLKTLVKPISNAVPVTNLHPCFEKSIGGDGRRVYEMQLFFKGAWLANRNSILEHLSERMKGFSVEKMG